ncbi:hypothetical protein BH09SUM1_BH09SUM1_27330 [soil metagenome]
MLNVSELLQIELDEELQITRAMLARVPMDKRDWKPHGKSMSLGRLAVHLTEIPSWTSMMILMNEFTLDMANYKPATAETGAELMKLFDGSVATAKVEMAKLHDGMLEKNWKMFVNGAVVVDATKYEVIRRWVINHIVHHRAQLGVYLRLLNVAIPITYGSSADEMPGSKRSSDETMKA